MYYGVYIVHEFPSCHLLCVGQWALKRIIILCMYYVDIFPHAKFCLLENSALIHLHW